MTHANAPRIAFDPESAERIGTARRPPDRLP